MCEIWGAVVRAINQINETNTYNVIVMSNTDFNLWERDLRSSFVGDPWYFHLCQFYTSVWQNLWIT